MTTPAAQQQQPPVAGGPPQPTGYSSTGPLPLFDLFLDVPNPGASSPNPPHQVVAPPSNAADKASAQVQAEISDERAFQRIVRFAFPEYDDRTRAQELARLQQLQKSRDSPNFNRHDVYLQDFDGGRFHSFVMQLSTGTRVFGHVRRYLPHNPVAEPRVDVGRRSVRSLVLITRISGAEKLLSSLLKTLEAIESQQVATMTEMHASKTPKQAFLHAVHSEFARLSREYTATMRANPDAAPKPLHMTVQGVEFGNRPLYLQLDVTSFRIEPPLLRAGGEGTNLVDPASLASSSAVMPVLRCLGATHTIRLLTAMLCEKRIILVGRSASRVSACARAAVAILEQGVLSWQQMFVPILPPGMLSHLAAPMPYIVGLLDIHARGLEQIPGIGEVFVVNLDQPSVTPLNSPHPNGGIPDVLRSRMNDQGFPVVSIAELLGQDLDTVVKSDKSGMNGHSAIQEKLGNAAGKANVLVKSALGRLRDMRKGNSVRSDLRAGIENGSTHGGHGDDDDESAAPVATETDLYDYGEGYDNKMAEEEARIAFVSFFLGLMGDMRWYLTVRQQGELPSFDRDKFLEERRRQGDSEGSPMLPLVKYFVQTKTFEQFVKSRVHEVQLRMPVSKDAPLFLQCSNYHRMHQIDFALVNVRKVVRQVAQSEHSPIQVVVQWNETIRRRALSLTSNSRDSMNVVQTIGRLADDCRESSGVLVDVMSVLWMRIRDCRGGQWKHGLFALQVLRSLLLHGPLTAISEAFAGLGKIRQLKSYDDNRNKEQCSQIRALATLIYTLLVDRARLFSQRRATIEFLRIRKPSATPTIPRLVRDSRINVSVPFRNMHGIVRPTILPPGSTAVGAPPQPPRPSPSQEMPAAVPESQAKSAYDLLPFDFVDAPASAIPTNTAADRKASYAQSGSNDMQGLVDVFGSTSLNPTPAPGSATASPAASFSHPQQNPPIPAVGASVAPANRRTSYHQPAPAVPPGPFPPVAPPQPPNAMAFAQRGALAPQPAPVVPQYSSGYSQQSPMQHRPSWAAAPQVAPPAFGSPPQAYAPVQGQQQYQAGVAPPYSTTTQRHPQPGAAPYGAMQPQQPQPQKGGFPHSFDPLKR